jgi:hypothetical protein
MPRRLDQWRALGPWERRLLMRLVLLLPMIGAALHLFGYQGTRDRLARLSRPSGRSIPTEPCDTPGETAGRIARLVGIAANHGPYRATCLRQSLAVWWLLRRRGVAAEVRIGVRKEGGELQAHAWVEHQGRAVNHAQSVTASYAPFPVPAAGVIQP